MLKPVTGKGMAQAGSETGQGFFIFFFRFCSPRDAPNEWETGLWVAKSAAVAARGEEEKPEPESRSATGLGVMLGEGPASLEDGCFVRGSLAVPGRWKLLQDRSVQRGFVLAGTRQAPPGWRSRARRN